MSKTTVSQHSPLFYCIAIASTFFPITAIAAPLLPSPPLLEQTFVAPEADAPLCYIRFQGSSVINISQVCGKKPGEPSAAVAVPISSAAAPPVFDPQVVNASTTGQCNFIDANGKPCQQKQ